MVVHDPVLHRFRVFLRHLFSWTLNLNILNPEPWGGGGRGGGWGGVCV